ncbi:MAG: hypothetical protein Kow0031_15700 [Anaerolineae bacterium]
MSFNYTIYDVTVTPLTPLHIGSGKLLLNEYDYALYGKHTWRIDENAWLEAQDVDDPKLVEQLSRTPPAQLLEPADFQPGSPFFRYRLAGKPRATGAGAQLQEMVKTVSDEAYLPGSSLKGAIRTALAWRGWSEMELRPNPRDLDRRRSFAARDIEKKIMGRNPNHDLLRALHVSDSAPVGKDKFIVLNAQVITRGSLGSPIELEAIHPDTPFRLTIKVDDQLFSQWATSHRLQLGGSQSWLADLTATIQQHTTQRLQAEANWYGNRPGAGQTAGFYKQLLGIKLPAGKCLLQVGWGTGWEDKTFGSHLQADVGFMERIIGDYRLAKGRREKGDPFPKSRRVTVGVVKDRQGRRQQRPAVPLGWVLLEMKERKK